MVTPTRSIDCARRRVGSRSTYGSWRWISRRPEVDFGADPFDVIVVTRYLHRPLMPHLVSALAPGGILIYETFLVGQAERGHPTNPEFLLKPGRAGRRWSARWEILRAREGEADGAMVASVVARRGSTSTGGQEHLQEMKRSESKKCEPIF